MFQPLACPPAYRYVESQIHGKLLVRGDSEGAVMVWSIADIVDSNIQTLEQDVSKPPGKFFLL